MQRTSTKTRGNALVSKCAIVMKMIAGKPKLILLIQLFLMLGVVDFSYAVRIANRTGGTIFWRVFKSDDTVFAVGLMEGSIVKWQIGEWREDAFGKIKIEIKSGTSIFDKTLVKPGKIYNMTDDLIFDGTSLRVAVATVTKKSESDSELVTAYVFRDLRDMDSGDPAPTETLTFEVIKGNTSEVSSIKSNEITSTWSVGGTVGGTIGKKGAAGNAEVSAEFTQSATDKLEESFSKNVTETWATKAEETRTFKPGYINMVAKVWVFKVEKGTVEYFNEKTAYTTIRGISTHNTIEGHYKTVEEMGFTARAEFEKTTLR